MSTMKKWSQTQKALRTLKNFAKKRSDKYKDVDYEDASAKAKVAKKMTFKQEKN